VQISAATQAVDGMTLSDFDVMYGRSVDQLPSRDDQIKRVKALAARLTGLRTAALVERYTGPVLIEGQAAAEVFLQGLANVLVGVPRIVVDDLRFEAAYNSNTGLSDRIGAAFCPTFSASPITPPPPNFRAGRSTAATRSTTRA
jgi:hypothetical protein